MDRSAMLNMLHEGTCQVTFTKLDGTKRVMKCTLKSEKINSLIDSGKLDAPGSSKQKSDEVISVIDLDKDAWRSFRVDSVEDIKSSVE